MDSVTDTASRSGSMDDGMRVSGTMERPMAKERCSMLTATSMKVTGLMTRYMELAPILTQMEPNTPVNGKTT